ncbi:hypothetical protein VZT92_005711 [Zoarces viviparus]|uniref:Uncharacterized protein n=1 Tax=Zoarces viviparus TaxID=48416 RepID=A0AAW1FVC1_ZOAVI
MRGELRAESQNSWKEANSISRARLNIAGIKEAKRRSHQRLTRDLNTNNTTDMRQQIHNVTGYMQERPITVRLTQEPNTFNARVDLLHQEPAGRSAPLQRTGRCEGPQRR